MAGRIVSVSLPVELADALRAAARKHRVTLSKECGRRLQGSLVADTVKEGMGEGRILHFETLPNGEGRMLIGTSGNITSEIGEGATPDDDYGKADVTRVAFRLNDGEKKAKSTLSVND